MEWSNFDFAIKSALDLGAKNVRENMEAAGVNASGETSRSIEATDRQILASEVLEKTETGTPPKSQGGGISFAAAAYWVEVKPAFISPWAVVSAINLRGSRTFQRGGRTDIYTEEFISLEDNLLPNFAATGLENDVMDFLNTQL